MISHLAEAVKPICEELGADEPRIEIREHTRQDATWSQA